MTRSTASAGSRRDSIRTIRQASTWARALLDDSIPDETDAIRAANALAGTGTDPVAAANARIATARQTDTTQPVLAPSTPAIPAQLRRYLPLVQRGVVSAGELIRAHNVQQRAGGSIPDILTSFDSVSARRMAIALALQSGLRFVELEGLTPLPRLFARLEQRTLVTHQFLPIDENVMGTVVAVTDPHDRRLRSIIDLSIGGPVELVVATAADISEAINRVYGADSARSATDRLRDSRPEDSASVVMTGAQKAVGGGGLLLLIVALVLFTVPALIVVSAAATLFYLAAALYRVRLIQLATDPRLGPPGVQSAADLTVPEAQLPIYTILVPLYKEAAVVGRVARSLSRLDYPAHKLDVLLICEEDDDETIAMIRSMQLGAQFRLLVVPDSQPKTKPKACNYALDYARGEMAVIFDAEDDPDPDQLRRVLATLNAEGAEDVACVQARLNYANAEQNTLTRWFTAEYMMWFDLILPGLERIDAPIPLGGTSNHFRMSVLRELDGWDPFNVTEDADLGIRLYKRGYRTLNIDSTTYEEANSQLPNWIRQRSRWMKGHMQTWLVHNRNPRRTRRELGTRGWIGFQLTIGASALAALLNPIYWLLMVVWFASHLALLREIMPSYVYYLASINLLVWNFTFVYASAVGVARREATYLVRYALISPLYWVLISIATWKGAIQLVTKPFYWEKTVHGLDDAHHEAPEVARQASASVPT